MMATERQDARLTGPFPGSYREPSYTVVMLGAMSRTESKDHNRYQFPLSSDKTGDGPIAYAMGQSSIPAATQAACAQDDTSGMTLQKRRRRNSPEVSPVFCR